MLVLIVDFVLLDLSEEQLKEITRALKAPLDQIDLSPASLTNHIEIASKMNPDLVLLHQNSSPLFEQLDDGLKYAQFGLADQNTLMRVEKVASVRRGPWK